MSTSNLVTELQPWIWQCLLSILCVHDTTLLYAHMAGRTKQVQGSFKGISARRQKHYSTTEAYCASNAATAATATATAAAQISER
eukprot:13206-Heterococcus_DN1.PRE.14